LDYNVPLFYPTRENWPEKEQNTEENHSFDSVEHQINKRRAFDIPMFKCHFRSLSLWNAERIKGFIKEKFPLVNVNSCCCASLELLCDAPLSAIEEIRKYTETGKFTQDLAHINVKLKTEVTMELASTSYLELKSSLKEQLKISKWNFYYTTFEKPEQTNLSWEEANAIGTDLGGYLGGCRFINVKFQPMSIDGKSIVAKSSTGFSRNMQGWESYGWVEEHLKKLSMDDLLLTNLLIAHFGGSVCRKLAFDPVNIDIDGHKWF